jgi:hypothetical protein
MAIRIGSNSMKTCFYRRVPKGWHRSRIIEAATRHGKFGLKYVLVDFNTLTGGYEDAKVPGFFGLSYAKDGSIVPSEELVQMAEYAGVKGEFKDMKQLLSALAGKFVMINVEYHKAKRPQRAVAYRPACAGNDE